MKAGVAELKARLSQYLARVKAGQEILVTDHGRPVARLMPVGEAEKGTRRERLIAEGQLVPGRGRPRPSLLKPPAPGAGAAVVDALLEERREGR